MYEYIGILLGVHYILHISRIRVKRRSVFAVARRCLTDNTEPRAGRRTPLLFVSHNSGSSNSEKRLVSVLSVVKPDVLLLAPETVMKRTIDDFTRWFILSACQACWATRGVEFWWYS